MSKVCTAEGNVSRVAINPEYVESYEYNSRGELYVNMRSSRQHQLKEPAQAKAMKDELDRAYSAGTTVDRPAEAAQGDGRPAHVGVPAAA